MLSASFVVSAPSWKSLFTSAGHQWSLCSTSIIGWQSWQEYLNSYITSKCPSMRNLPLSSLARRLPPPDRTGDPPPCSRYRDTRTAAGLRPQGRSSCRTAASYRLRCTTINPLLNVCIMFKRFAPAGKRGWSFGGVFRWSRESVHSFPTTDSTKKSGGKIVKRTSGSTFSLRNLMKPFRLYCIQDRTGQDRTSNRENEQKEMQA